MRSKPSGAETSADTTREGVIIEWNGSRGYGFVDDGKHRVFAHIRDFTERPRTPQPGDKVSLHHYLAVDAQLGWRLFRQARAWIESLG